MIIFNVINRRTADVRSVGYSELFSLSQEDVLSAIKDYPEAREILQAFGNKRLKEVRNINKKHATKVSERENIASNVSYDKMYYVDFQTNKKQFTINLLFIFTCR